MGNGSGSYTRGHTPAASHEGDGSAVVTVATQGAPFKSRQRSEGRGGQNEVHARWELPSRTSSTVRYLHYIVRKLLPLPSGIPRRLPVGALCAGTTLSIGSAAPPRCPPPGGLPPPSSPRPCRWARACYSE